ncbi:zinc finger C2HC domain-containing protein 1C-like isoform X1, partial [Elysia marginata]
MFQERREAALRKKREAAERARQKKLEEERRKEEERQRKQEEEEERQERKREEQRLREEEKRNREDEKRRKDEDKRRYEEERRAAKRQAEEERRLAKKQQQQQQQYSARNAGGSDYNSGYDDDHNSPVHSSRHANAHDTFRARSGNAPPIDEKPVAAAGNDASFYMKAAASSDAKGSVGSLMPCRQCGRKFAPDRLKKHQDACVKANKPRKEFNAALKRVEGTEMAKYAGKNRKPDPPVRD